MSPVIRRAVVATTRTVIDTISSYSCPTLTPWNRYEYKGLNYTGIAHAYFAKYGEASLFYFILFYFTDKSFHGLEFDPDISIVIIIAIED